MIPETPATEAALDELQTLLEKQFELLELRCKQLDEIADAVIKRDNDRLEKLLGDVQMTQDQQVPMEKELEQARRGLSEAIGWPETAVKLSRLAGELNGPRKAVIDKLYKELAEIIDDFRQRHLRTTVILNECARINRLLLENIMPDTAKVTTYGGAGANSWQSGRGVMDRKV